MTTSTNATDRGIGLSVLFGALAVLGAIVMAVGAPEQLAAWGFAAAVIFGCLAVVAAHKLW
ncbi:hypothetical protein C479_03316 [Halovivax asiaticus JCM 14624]|uniref:Uncharacterized protein n=1 Tax=Halovivax asiaticus JCM 14624 TaxID=1227490 RepID=M0BUQ2_9EURY|nr:hypothetical protein [Halovivax asiaticus]ELZ13842.1 hypothetical protein C479_03316 [Halovivax asiaticus JCM 14624]